MSLIIMQLYFKKKFMQLDLLVNIEVSLSDAVESLHENPDFFGVLFLSYPDIEAYGIEKTFSTLIPKTCDPSLFSIIVYEIDPDEEDDVLSILDNYGVSDILRQPYSLSHIRVSVYLVFTGFADNFCLFGTGFVRSSQKEN